MYTYLCRVTGGELQPGVDPDDALDGQATIRALGWFDLRNSAGENPELAQANLTLPTLHRIRALLGYGGA